MDKPNQLFKAFSDETRLRILNLLAQRDHCVCEFQSILRVPQPTISRHLAYLRRSGLVEVERHGKMIMYSLAEPRAAKCMRRCCGACAAVFRRSISCNATSSGARNGNR